jgi:hypothetical protein
MFVRELLKPRYSLLTRDRRGLGKLDSRSVLGRLFRQVRPVGEGKYPQHDDVSEWNEPEQYPPPAISRFLYDFDPRL